MKEEPSYTEAWWERELHRNEKLMDRYLAALADNPDLARLRKPDDGPEPHAGDSEMPAENTTPDSAEPLDVEQLNEIFLEAGAAAGDAAGEDTGERVEEAENAPPSDAGYFELARAARHFAVAIGSLEPCSEIPEILFLSAPKVGANLAGGHGLGYDEETLCGNIVKCRWALADCEFCREMLDHLVQRTRREVYRSLLSQSAQLSAQIRERIERLRARVWW